MKVPVFIISFNRLSAEDEFYWNTASPVASTIATLKNRGVTAVRG